MLPFSIAHPAPVPSASQRAGMRPANVPLAGSWQTRALRTWGVLLGGLCLFLLLGHVWVRIKVVEVGYQLSVTRQLVERLEQEGRELAVRAAAADADGRLEDLAVQRLAMRRPQREEEGLLP